MTPKKLALTLAFALLAVASLAHAAAPPGRYTTTPEVVSDTSTGLQWQRIVDANPYSQANALAYCGDLTLGGETDWRVPTLHELLSIADPTEAGPAMDPSAFPAPPAGWYWTASPYVGAAGAWWFVDFGIGSSSIGTVGEAAWVRCVR